MPWWAIVLVVLLVPLYKWGTNMLYANRCKEMEELHLSYLAEDADINSALEHSGEIARLFAKSGLRSPVIPNTVEHGYGQISVQTVRVFDNLFSRREDIAVPVHQCFSMARGVYKDRAWDAINPLYWIDAALHLPAHVLAYVGVKPDSIASKVLNVIYWLITATIGLLKTGVIDWIKGLISGVSP